MHDMETRCSKCGSEMEDGFLVDTVFPGSAMLEPQGENLLWAKGSRSSVPMPGWFSKLKSGIGFLVSSTETKPVASVRSRRKCQRQHQWRDSLGDHQQHHDHRASRKWTVEQQPGQLD